MKNVGKKKVDKTGRATVEQLGDRPRKAENPMLQGSYGYAQPNPPQKANAKAKYSAWSVHS